MMPSVERMLDEYLAQADRARAWGNAGLFEADKCRRHVRALTEVLVGDMKREIGGSRG